ncbi:MAG: FAD/NAD(P)-binding protein [Woeseia sp.]
MIRKHRQLGMNRDITRRDFLNGSRIAVAGSLLAQPLSQALGAAAPVRSAQDFPGYYPPSRDGLRGSHAGSFEVAHELRDGARFDDPSASTDTGEIYDLVVVGGGLSGLAAAHFFRKETDSEARILIIENHDDFGGHAKRNEFEYKGRTLVDLGGAEYIEAPWRYPDSARSLLQDIGIDVDLAPKVFDHELYPSLGMQCGVFFDRKTFGQDKLVAGDPDIALSDQQYAYVTLPAELEKSVGAPRAIRAFLDKSPLSAAARREVFELFCENKDYLHGKSHLEKLNLIQSISYRHYLQKYAGVSAEVVDFFWMWHGGYMGIGTDLWPAISAFRFGLPGGTGLGLGEAIERNDAMSEHSYREDFHFPDGNASIARLLVRNMIPAVASGNSMHDIVSARFDYGELDRSDSPVRIRLNATAVHVRHLGEPDTAKQVEVTYVRDGVASRVRGRHCVMACYHAIVPHLCQEIPAEQREALGKTIRTPLVSTSVLVDNWRAFHELGIFAAYCPGSYFCDVRLTYPLQFADYEAPRSPDEPTTVHLYRVPVSGEGSGIEQFRAGRYELLGTPFATFEQKIREQLGAMLAEGGFDPARDIKGISVNRWPHGYAVGYDYQSGELNWFGNTWPEDHKLWLRGRQRFGRIAIANSDAGASAMTESAIEQGYRATRDLLHDS